MCHAIFFDLDNTLVDREEHDLAGATAARFRARLVDSPLNAELLAALLQEEGLA